MKIKTLDKIGGVVFLFLTIAIIVVFYQIRAFLSGRLLDTRIL